MEGVGGIVREITGTVIFGVCKVKGKNVERWPTYTLIISRMCLPD